MGKKAIGLVKVEKHTVGPWQPGMVSKVGM